jgi:fructose-bisphosphate aldolase class I
MEMTETINRIFDGYKGILAADESTPTIQKRFDSVGMSSTPETRHDYRHNLFSTEGLERYIGGVILYDETIRNKETIAPLLDKGIALGIKVDGGAKPYNKTGGNLTEGLDGLTERLREYKDLGAKFAKWRAVINVNDTDTCLLANAWTLARYARKCQEEKIVPIVEPEVLMDGVQTIWKSFDKTEKILHILFDALYWERVDLEQIILKPNMVVSGYKGAVRERSEGVSAATLNCLRRTVPSAVPAIAFLSGGQKDEEAINNLAEMNKSSYLPWIASFSFGRTMQNGALKLWADNQKGEAKSWTWERAKACSEAVTGKSIRQEK